MVSVEAQVAGFGGGAQVDLHEIHLIIKYAVMALFVVNFFFAPANKDAFTVIAENIIGWPSCESTFCIGPAQASLENTSNSFLGLVSGALTLDNLVKLALGLLDTLKGIVGLAVLLEMFFHIKSMLDREKASSGPLQFLNSI